MSDIDSPNMNLPVPVVGQAPGPDYAKSIDNCLALIDAHDHSPGKGVPITPTGLNINAALSLQTNFLTNAAGVVFTPQTVTPGLGTIYVNGVDLYYVDENNNNIRLTQNGGIAGTSGSIANLVPPASAAYVSGLSAFVWQSNTGIAANMDFGSATLRNLSPNSTFGLTLAPPAGLSSNYTITLPVLPASPSLLTIDNAGNMSASPLLNKGITAANIADGTLTTTQISPTAGILGSQLSATADIMLGQLDAAVLRWNTTTITTTGTFTVPTNVNRLQVIGVGGGGGAGGVATSAPQTGGAGGGSTPMLYWIPVTPGDVLTATIGTGGAGSGPGGSVAGGTGGNTTLAYATGTLIFFGASGGGGNGAGTGGVTQASPVSSAGGVQSGGSSGSGGGQQAIATTYVANGAAGGAPGGGGAWAGGGGGSGLGPGSPGTNAVSSAPCINAANATNPGSGGGASGASSVYISGGAGGNGAPGAVVISWLGHP